MEHLTKLQELVAGMSPDEFFSTLLEALQACVGEALNPLPPPAPAPPQLNIQYMWPANNAQVLTAVREPAAAPQQIIDVPMVNLPEGQHLCYVGMINGQELYQVLYTEVPPPYFQFPVPAAPSLSYNSKKRWHNKQQDTNRPYVRKPLNAFMLYMKEHRDLVKAEVAPERRGTAAENEILGQRWKAMTKEDKEKYFSQSQEEKRLHAQQNPHWSNRDNYGRKIKKRRHACSSEKASAPAKKQCVTALSCSEAASGGAAAPLTEDGDHVSHHHGGADLNCLLQP
ncbi:transcription factor 7-like 1 [Pseudochaenichthys georgianus]|uniref:transcription factor 7-like 1 n=1 Tax=Pseudochaenichthys georgianus TaxID=52239 RepID=UPI00146B3A3C|nr:transcription factor 7-like 1 [Pseudochaenichthys georgianus]